MVDWSNCDLIETVPGKHSGDPVFKNTRLPVSAVVENVQSFMEVDGLSLDDAVNATLECYPSTPGGAQSIRAVLEYHAIHEPMLQP